MIPRSFLEAVQSRHERPGPIEKIITKSLGPEMISRMPAVVTTDLGITALEVLEDSPEHIQDIVRAELAKSLAGCLSMDSHEKYNVDLVWDRFESQKKNANDLAKHFGALLEKVMDEK